MNRNATKPRDVLTVPCITWFGLQIEPARLDAHALEWSWLLQHRYVLLDGQRAEELPEGFATLNLCPSALSGSAHLMPRLVDLQALQSNQVTWLLDTINRCASSRDSPPFTALLMSDTDPERVARHLANAQLRRHGKDQAWLRIHDPMVFVQLPRVMDMRSFANLMGPITQWSICIAGEWFATRLVPSDSATSAAAGTPTQRELWQRLLRIGAVNRSLLRREWLSLPAILEHSVHLDGLAHRAETRHALYRLDDQAGFASLAAELVLEFDEHPLIERFVREHRRQQHAEAKALALSSLVDELEQLPQTTWEQVRKDCALDSVRTNA